MAGNPIGATAPTSPAHSSAPQRAHLHAVATTRTRRNHGCFLLGNELASVYSSRRVADGLGVVVNVGNGPLMLTGSMSSSQARAMARALLAAANAADAPGAST